jgi:hypothetical protein
MQRNAEVGLFTKPSNIIEKFLRQIKAVLTADSPGFPNNIDVAERDGTGRGRAKKGLRGKGTTSTMEWAIQREKCIKFLSAEHGKRG